MSEVSYFVGPVVALAMLTIVVVSLLRKRLRERHALWWGVGAALVFLLSLFPNVLSWLSSALGIVVPLNLAFILAITLIFLVSLQHSAELTALEEKVRTLAEHVAELEMSGRPPAPARESADEPLQESGLESEDDTELPNRAESPEGSDKHPT